MSACTSIKTAVLGAAYLYVYTIFQGAESRCISYASREYPVIDCRDDGRIYRTRAAISSGEWLTSCCICHPIGNWHSEERVVWLNARDAISWLHETPEEFGYFWEFARKVARLAHPRFDAAPGSSLTAWLAENSIPTKPTDTPKDTMTFFRTRACDEVPSDEYATIGSSDKSSEILRGSVAGIPAKEKESLYAACDT